jgi:hypothetical protein
MTDLGLRVRDQNKYRKRRLRRQSTLWHPGVAEGRCDLHKFPHKTAGFSDILAGFSTSEQDAAEQAGTVGGPA